MKLSTKSRYGIRAMFELACNFSGEPVSINTISQNQDISKKYLHNLLTVLKSSGLVRSVWGSKGGFVLAKEPSQITLYEIVAALEGPISVVDCINDDGICDRVSMCVVREIWEEVNRAIENVLYSQTLNDLLINADKFVGKIKSAPEYYI